MRKTIVIVVIIAVAAASGYGYYVYTRKDPPPTVSTAKVTRGDVAETVGATGTLQAVTTVQVGSQVSGIVQALNADFNSLVHKGQVIARLDPSLFQTQIEQAQANLIRAQADLERLKVSAEDGRTKLRRAEELSAKQLIAQTDLEAAQVAVRSADAQVRSQEAAVTQSQASLRQNQVNLDHTIIEAPIDGLVISRNVDVGQTVAASMSAPTLFILAADLTKMQVVASLDESDVGRIRPGQVVTFRVDAYPNEQFTGAVTQVRLQPQTVQNVVTYSTVIDVPNPELKLKPGMTANVNIEIARRNNVLRVSNAALRFRPTTDVFEALGQTPPAAGGGRGGGRGGRGGSGSGNAPAGTDSMVQPSKVPAPSAGAVSSGSGSVAPPVAAQIAGQGRSGLPAAGAAADKATDSAQPADQATKRRRSADQTAVADPAAANDGGGGRRGGNGGRGNFQERMANMTPEERLAMMERMRARGMDPEAMMAGRGGGQGTGGRQGGAAQSGQPAGAAQTGGNRAAASGSQSSGRGAAPAGASALALRAGSATTIDALFGPLPKQESFGQVWLFKEGKLNRMPLRLGISDGQQTEMIQGDLKDEEDVVTNVTTAAQRRASAAAGSSLPIFGQQNRGGFPGGGGGFGGGGAPRGGGGGGARGGGR